MLKSRSIVLAAISLPAACAAPEETGAPAAGLDAAARYRTEIMGRWGETPACDDWVWEFRERTLTGPGGMDAPNGISCADVRTSEGADGAVRIVAVSCNRGAMLHGDVVMDARRTGRALELTGVFESISPARWWRCEE